MKDRLIIGLIVFGAIMYGIGSVGASILEEYTALIYFTSGMIYGALGYAYATSLEGENDE